MTAPGVLSVAKTQALVPIDACIKGRKFAVIRRPSGFGVSTLVSTVCNYYDVDGHDDSWWPCDDSLDVVQSHAFLVFHLDFLDPSIDPANAGDTFLAYIQRQIEAFLEKYADLIPEVVEYYSAANFSLLEVTQVLVSSLLQFLWVLLISFPRPE